MKIYWLGLVGPYPGSLSPEDIHSSSRRPPQTRARCWITCTSRDPSSVYSQVCYALTTAITILCIAYYPLNMSSASAILQAQTASRACRSAVLLMQKCTGCNEAQELLASQIACVGHNVKLHNTKNFQLPRLLSACWPNFALSQKIKKILNLIITTWSICCSWKMLWDGIKYSKLKYYKTKITVNHLPSCWCQRCSFIRPTDSGVT